MNDRSQSVGMAMVQYLCLLAMIVLYGLQILARTSRIEQEITCLAQGYTVIHAADSMAMFDVCLLFANWVDDNAHQRNVAASLPSSPTAPPNVREAMIAADLKAPLCAKCEADDIYERSPESCAECAANRIDAILSLPASAEQPK